ALAFDANGNLYAGGGFTAVGGISRSCLAKFDTAGVLTSFNPNMGGGFANNSYVYALVLDANGNLYAGGDFTTVGGISRNRLSKFDNTGALTSFDPNMNSWVWVFALDAGENLHVGGYFSSRYAYFCFTPPIVTSTTPGAICGAGTVNLEATASSGTIKWYVDSTGGSSL